MDCFFAIIFVPEAKTIVTIDVSASGIAATAIAIANIKEFIKSPPLKTSSANINPAKNTIAIPNFFPKSSNFSWSGVCLFPAVSSKSAILPTSVFIPVDVTTKVALP